jgi:hypothetical protein
VAVARRPYRALAACLLAPAGAAVLRKVVPGQPTYLEIGGIIAVLGGGVWVVLRRKRLPHWVLIPLLVWAYFQLVYAAFAVSVDWRVAAAATLTRIAPMLMAGIAFASLRNGEDFRRAVFWLGSLAVAMVPIALMIVAFGDSILPFWLRPILALEELSRNERKGILAVSGVFTTQSVMAMSMLAVVFLALAAAALAEAEDRPPGQWWVFATSATALVFLSTRRGAFLAAVLGIGAYVLTREKVPTKLVLGGTAAVAGGILVERLGSLGTRWGISRGDLLLDALDLSTQIPFRLYQVFGRLFIAWVLEAPFGTYLGFAGPEGDALVGRGRLADYIVSVFEVGGAQLLAEMGILGAILMPVIVAILIWQIRRQTVGLKCRRAVDLLLFYEILFFALYYLKEESVMTGVSMGQLTFWAVPGIAAALIVRERREQRYWKSVAKYRERLARNPEAHAGG